MLASLRYLLRQRMQTTLCIVGIALGVAVILAVDLANESARRAFEIANDTIAGRASHAIRGGPGGVDEGFYVWLRVARGLRKIAPVVTGTVSTTDGRPLQVLGIDPLVDGGVREYGRGGTQWRPGDLIARPLAAVITGDTARALDLERGQALTVRAGGAEHVLTIMAVLMLDDPFTAQGLRSVVLTDIGTAQQLLDMTGRLSHIDVAVDRPQELRALLPPALTLVPSAARTNAMTQMTRAFDINLTALSLLAILIGAFLIYNTMLLATLRRRPLIARLRAIGVARGQILAVLLGEAGLLATVGIVFGFAVGLWLAEGLLGLVTRTINDLYFVVEVESVSVSGSGLIKAAVIGLAASLLAAFAPAWEASRLTPRLAFSRAHLEARARHVQRGALRAGVASAALAALILVASGKSIVAGFVGLFLIVASFALLAPACIQGLVVAAAPVAERWFGLRGRWATRAILSSMSRTQVAVIALAIAVSATVGVSVMITSFRASVVTWLENTLRADVYISQPAAPTARGIESALIDRLRTMPPVRNLSTGRWTRLQTAGEPTRLFVIDVDADAFASYQMKDGVGRMLWQDLRGRDMVIVSEAYAYHNRIAVGDSLSLPTDAGPQSFEVAGVFYDYRSDRGVVVMHRQVYDRHWSDPVVTSLALYLRAGEQTDVFLRSLETGPLRNTGLRARANRSIRDLSLQIFDRTFAVTEVLRLLTIVVACIGIIAALSAIQLERAREFAVLRASGLTRGELFGLQLGESGLIGVISGLLSMPLGLMMALALVFVINRRSFGWSMQMDWTAAPFLTALTLSALAGIFAGLYPAWRLAQTSPAAALRDEE